MCAAPCLAPGKGTQFVIPLRHALLYFLLIWVSSALSSTLSLVPVPPPPRCFGVCPFPEPRPLLSFSLQSCSSCDPSGPSPPSGALPAFLSPRPFLRSFYSWLDQPLPLSIPRKGLSRWCRGEGPEPRRKPAPEAPACPRTRLPARCPHPNPIASVIFRNLAF